MNIYDRYFEWLCSKVTTGEQRKAYSLLLKTLDETSFTVILPMDDNRWHDGTELRHYFGRECGYLDAQIASTIDAFDCSVLEMMVALSESIEQIEDDPVIGNQTSRWFWTMIDSMGLTDMDDNNFDHDNVLDILNRMMFRNYKRNGKGGLFTLKNPPRDMRSTEIWYQAQWYLIELHAGSGIG